MQTSDVELQEHASTAVSVCGSVVDTKVPHAISFLIVSFPFFLHNTLCRSAHAGFQVPSGVAIPPPVAAGNSAADAEEDGMPKEDPSKLERAPGEENEEVREKKTTQEFRRIASFFLRNGRMSEVRITPISMAGRKCSLSAMPLACRIEHQHGISSTRIYIWMAWGMLFRRCARTKFAIWRFACHAGSVDDGAKHRTEYHGVANSLVVLPDGLIMGLSIPIPLVKMMRAHVDENPCCPCCTCTLTGC